MLSFFRIFGAIGLSSSSRIIAILCFRLKLGIFLRGDFAFGLYRVMVGGGVASLELSNMRIATVISMQTFPSVCPSNLLGGSIFGPHEIMWTLFFGAGGGELGDSSLVSLLLLF
ncbi:hypothetical protein F2Q69_00022369 [Brassica cretica]|uniref:Uncharacterized protein n=1 Tax=Brassica cretica TaxID=69181 RepID=A0A8S9QDU6_BRACR|nr:hypothetical protein F2Q69_00022369 [Brassica cretica]